MTCFEIFTTTTCSRARNRTLTVRRAADRQISSVLRAIVISPPPPSTRNESRLVIDRNDTRRPWTGEKRFDGRAVEWNPDRLDRARLINHLSFSSRWLFRAIFKTPRKNITLARICIQFVESYIYTGNRLIWIALYVERIFVILQIFFRLRSNFGLVNKYGERNIRNNYI